MSSDPQPPAAPRSSRTIFFQGAFVVGLAVGAMLLLLSSHQQPGGNITVPTPMPPIVAAGWVNGPAPKPGELEGKVLLVEAWASWCGPCRRQAPEMVHLYEKFHDQGVEFIGLTLEPEEALPSIERFLKTAGIKWRNGYGAGETLRALGADYIPMVWVVDRQHRIVWNHGSSISLEEGLREALLSQPSVDSKRPDGGVQGAQQTPAN